MWNNQNGLCAICGAPETTIDPQSNEIKWLSVDHDHETGKIRGLLCQSCNHMLGQSGDDPTILKAGAEYVLRNKPT